MTSSPATDTSQAAGTDLTGLHELLWQVRHDSAMARRVHDDPVGVCGDFGIPPDIAVHLSPLDVAALLQLGTNPYLLFFAALDLGVPRADYYAQVTGGAHGG